MDLASAIWAVGGTLPALPGEIRSSVLERGVPGWLKSVAKKDGKKGPCLNKEKEDDALRIVQRKWKQYAQGQNKRIGIRTEKL